MEVRDNFTGKLGIVLATVGSAVGLGNIWRFPYEAGQNGGGAFILIYLVCVFLLGFPLVMAEFAVGIKAKANVVGSFKSLAPNTKWFFVGLMGVLAGFMIMGFYYVVTGWTAEYFWQAIQGNLLHKSPEEYKQMFDSFVTNPFKPVFWTIVMIAFVHIVIINGIKNGIEKVSKILMPILFVLMIILAIHSLMLPNAMEGVRFMFEPKFEDITSQGVLTALGQAFFSLSLGMGCLITYASYFGKDTHVSRTAFQVTSLDTLVAIVAGVVIFPAVFSFGMQPDEGTGLVFVMLPTIFQQMPVSYFWSSLFYLLLALAAFTSVISLHEVVTAYVKEEFAISRKKAVTIVSVSVLVLAIFASLSLGGSVPPIAGKTVFEWLDFITASILLPLGGVAVSVFVGWYLDKRILLDVLQQEGKRTFHFFKTYIFVLRYLAPACILVVFFHNLLA
jgi:neurotransmitter:Na+ symporter, NSS family